MTGIILADIHTDYMIFHHSLDNQRTEHYALHCHNFYEVFYFIAGDVSYLVEGHRYIPTPHSILLIPPNVFHGVKVESDGAYERFALHFVPGILPLECRSTLLSPFHASSGPSDIYFTDAEGFGMQPFFEQLMACRTMNEPIRELSLSIRLQALLSQIAHRRSSQRGDPTATARKSVTRIIHFLNDHITDPLTLDDLAARFYISKHHLNKVFRQATGTTVGNYVIHKRAVLAQQLMMQGQSAAMASTNAGFGDYTSFYRAYRKIFGHAPSDKQGPILLL